MSGESESMAMATAAQTRKCFFFGGEPLALQGITYDCGFVHYVVSLVILITSLSLFLFSLSLQTVHTHKPHFMAVHCQEVGGKNYEASMSHVDTFVK